MKNEVVKEVDIREQNDLEQAFCQADITLHKDYLTMLADDNLAIIKEAPDELQNIDFAKSCRFYRLEKVCYNKEEGSLEKLATVFNAEY